MLGRAGWAPLGRRADIAAQRRRFPGGRIALFWNGFEVPAELGERFNEVYRRVLPDMPMFHRWTALGGNAYAALGVKAAEGMAQTGAFGPAEHWQDPWERPYTRDEWLDQLPTTGGHNHLAPNQLTEILDGIGAAVDDAGGGFVMHYTTVTVSALRLAGS
ncbi:hypothetical protein [Dactylosporangium sp. CA-092794]|uniref:hypothetical protein n=1 Tax=Dactylosporangium sp. CA-092794 TaxID=3239929 RepID=UPI003D92DB1A